MKKTSEPIVFFGSGPVAAESLRLLLEHQTVEAVITKPRAPHHRGSVPVLELAEALHLPVHTVENRKQLTALFDDARFESRLGVLIDFGIIISQDVINYFPLGIINSHFSVLPQWRGADPITFSILSGQEQTGVSIMLLTAGMDEGPLLGYGEFDMPSGITTPELTEDLISLSDALLQHDLPRYMAGESHGVPQDITGREVSYSRKLTKDDGVLDFSKPANMLEREIRAFIEWPKSRATLGDMDIVVTKAHVVHESGKAGTVAIIDKLPVVYCGESALALDMLKPAGKKEMTGQAFLAGYKSHILGN
ncbi:MAG TPA: methionyl-tRNA formyltransferase [Candidatus Saccharimonadales bacterium]|nr:methionyl-tRNA formyltransferase [Candidatus Saccharimonadales bacterium]